MTVLEVKLFDPLTWETPFLVTVIALFCIVFCRAGGTYLIGRGIAGGTAKTRWHRLLDSKHYRTAQRWLDRWGAPAISFSFLTVGIQTMINLSAGVMRMSWKRYLPALVVGSILWALLYSTIGFVGIIAVTRLWAYSPMLTIGLAVAAVAALVLFFYRASRRKDGEREGAPLPEQDAASQAS